MTSETRADRSPVKKALILESMADAVVVVDATGFVCERNTAASEIFGSADGDLLGGTWHARDRRSTIPVEELPWTRALGGERVEQEELFFFGGRHPEGVWLSVNAVPVRTDGECIVAAIVTVRDVTGRKRREAREREVLLERAEGDKVSEIARVRREFVLSISHELRTPLTSILGYSDLLLEPNTPLDDDVSRRWLSVLNTSARRLQRLLDESLELQQLLDGAVPNVRAATSLRDVVRAALSSIHTRGRSLEARIADAVVFVDSVRVERAVNHLARNAVKHTPRGTHVVIEAELQGDDLIITVTDDGAGVPDALKDHIFEPFSHMDVEDPNPGQGIGLALVRCYVQAHGGDIRVEDADSGGARFVLIFASALPTGSADR